MADKNPKKSPKKPIPKIPKIPKDASVKVIEINPVRILLYIVALGIVAWSLMNAWSRFGTSEQITYVDDKGLNQIVAAYNSGAYEEIVISDNKLEAKNPALKNIVNGQEVSKRTIDRVTLPQNVAITDLGISDPKNPTKITVENNDFSKAAWDVTMTVLGTMLFVGLLVFLMSRMSGGGMGGPMAFIKSRAKVYDPENDEKVTFADVAGSDEEKADLEEVVDFLKNPGKYKDLGAKIPRGILLQ